jgi:hypothetical protein
VPGARWAGWPARFRPRSRRSNRYRNNGEPAITVQNVSVGDGGKAIVGNVTQHASVIVSDKNGATAVTDSGMVSMPDCGAHEHGRVDGKPEAQA